MDWGEFFGDFEAEPTRELPRLTNAEQVWGVNPDDFDDVTVVEVPIGPDDFVNDFVFEEPTKPLPESSLQIALRRRLFRESEGK